MYQIFFDGDKKINVELNLKNNQISGKIDNVNFSAELQHKSISRRKKISA